MVGGKLITAICPLIGLPFLFQLEVDLQAILKEIADYLKTKTPNFLFWRLTLQEILTSFFWQFTQRMIRNAEIAELFIKKSPTNADAEKSSQIGTTSLIY